MHLHCRNVNDAFRGIVRQFHGATTYNNPFGGIHSTFMNVPMSKRPSRNGNVLVIEEPVTITYSHPTERVLINRARCANPFFHIYEALWMLAGRNDIKPLCFYNKKMLDYSDDVVTQNGAYGYRWRHAWTTGEGRMLEDNVDQLKVLIDHLTADPNSRRAVLQMWNVEDDLLKIGSSLKPLDGTGLHNEYLPASKDVCCNLSVMFSMREATKTALGDPSQSAGGKPFHDSVTRCLDMTVVNRSNDGVWGMLGANYVHFTFLQEYMAARLGAKVGLYHHITNNLHVYDWNFKPEEWLKEPTWDYAKTVPLVDPAVDDAIDLDPDIKLFTDVFPITNDGPAPAVHNTWLNTVAGPMLLAFHYHKKADWGMRSTWLNAVEDLNWRQAADDWFHVKDLARYKRAEA